MQIKLQKFSRACIIGFFSGWTQEIKTYISTVIYTVPKMNTKAVLIVAISEKSSAQDQHIIWGSIVVYRLKKKSKDNLEKFLSQKK